MAEVLQRNRLQRAGNGDAGVVDEAVEAVAVALPLDLLGRGGDLLGIGDIEDDGDEARRSLLPQTLGVGLLADAGEDPPAGAVEAQSGRAADAGGRSRDKDG